MSRRMWWVTRVTLALGVVLSSLGWSSVAAETTRSSFSEPTTLCTVTDARLREISGAAQTAAGLTVANDKGAALASLDKACKVLSIRPFKGITGIDTEEVTSGPDGTVWLVDSGGNRVPRRDIALYGMRPNGTVQTARFVYPSGTHDAEAALVTLDNEFLLFTKERGKSRVFRAQMPGQSGDPTERLKPEGVVDVASFGTRPGAEGSLFVTGAALSPDGRHVSLRTYTDIFEWEVKDGDVARSVTTTQPHPVAKVTQQLQGEAITYAPDGESMLALSEQLPSPVLRIKIARHEATHARGQSGNPAWVTSAAAVPGVLLVLSVVTLIVLNRRRRVIVLNRRRRVRD